MNQQHTTIKTEQKKKTIRQNHRGILPIFTHYRNTTTTATTTATLLSACKRHTYWYSTHTFESSGFANRNKWRKKNILQSNCEKEWTINKFKQTCRCHRHHPKWKIPTQQQTLITTFRLVHYYFRFCNTIAVVKWRKVRNLEVFIVVLRSVSRFPLTNERQRACERVEYNIISVWYFDKTDIVIDLDIRSSRTTEFSWAMSCFGCLRGVGPQNPLATRLLFPILVLLIISLRSRNCHKRMNQMFLLWTRRV